MSYYGLTDAGKVRKNNEDAFAIKEISNNIVAMVVADGMGGHVGGSEASTTAVKDAMEQIESFADKLDSYKDKQYEAALKKVVASVNNAVYTKANENSELTGMGTTLVICIIIGNKYYAVNVGDSRLYLYSKKLSQVSKDHSYVAELVEMGIISEKQAQFHPNKNVITRAVGTEKNVIADMYTGELKNDDILLICSDGLSNMITNDAMESIIKKNTDVEKLTKKLVNQANKNGGTDNITAVTFKYEDVGGAQAL